MSWPDLMPEKFDFLRTIPRDKQFLAKLTTHSSLFTISFFTSAAEDETWTSANEGLMTSILHWIVKEFALYRIPQDEAELVLGAYYAHRNVLEPMLPRNVLMHVEGKDIAANSFLYSAQSVRLHAAMRGDYTQENPLTVHVGELPLQVFQYVHEFVCRGDIASLWREPVNVVLQVLQQAHHWEIVGLQNLCTQLIVRYLTPDNAMQILLRAYQYALGPLKEAALDKLNQMDLGLE